MTLQPFTLNGQSMLPGTQNRLQQIIDSMAFDQEPDQVLDQLEFAANDLFKTINDMKAGPREAQHYEQ